MSYPWIGLDVVGVGVDVRVLGCVVVGDGVDGGGETFCVLLLLPMVANNRLTLLVRFCSSLTLLVGYISCSGWRCCSSSICSCCLTMVSFNCRSAFAVCSLNPVDDDV